MRSVKEYFTLIYIVYISMFLLPCAFLFFALAETPLDNFEEEDIPYIITDTIIVILGLFAAYFFSQKNIKRAKQRRGLREKLINYRRALFILWAVIDTIILFSTAFYLLTGELFFICLSIFLFAVLFLNKPGLSTLIQRLDLPADEQRILENPKSAL